MLVDWVGDIFFSIKAAKKYVGRLWESGDFPGLHRIAEMLAYAISSAAHFPADIGKDREIVMLFEKRYFSIVNIQIKNKKKNKITSHLKKLLQIVSIFSLRLHCKIYIYLLLLKYSQK